MSGRPPSPARRRAALALIAVSAVAAAFGAAAPAAAAPAGLTDDPVNETTLTTTETTDDATDDVTTAVEETTSTTDDATATDDPTGSTTGTVTETTDDAIGTANETTVTLVAGVEHATALGSEPVADLTGTLDATVDGTTDPLPDALTVSGESALDVGEAVDPPTGAASARTDPVADRPEPAPTDGPERTLDVAAPSAGGPDEPAPLAPLLTGAVAASGLLVGAAALRGGLGLSTMARPRTGALRWAARAGAGRLRARWLDWLRRLGALVGYQRYDDSDPLEHETRAAVLEAIEASDAAYLAELGRETDVPLSTLRYHLRVLERESLVCSVRRRGKRCYVPAGDEPSALGAALGDDGAAAVLEALAAAGPDSVSGLAERLGRDVSTVTHHLQRLEADGLVVRERAGRAVENRLEPEARAALAGGPDRPTTAERVRAEARSD